MTVEAAVVLTQKTVDGQTAYDVSTERYNLTASPARGGMITAFEDKLDKKQLVIQKKFNGLFMDHLQCQYWPGEAAEVPYSHKLVKNTPEEVIIELAFTFAGKFHTGLNPEIKDIKLTKKFIFKAGHPGVICQVTISAPQSKSVLFAYWQQQILIAGGQYDQADDFSFRPTTRGVIKKSGTNFGYMGIEEFLKDYNDGWSAIIDRKTKSGLLFITDYNELRTLYCCAGNKTVEMFYRPTYLPAGKSQTYTTYMVPIYGVDNILSANENVILSGDINGHHGNGTIALSALESYNTAKGPVSVDLKAFSVETPDKVVKVGKVTFDKLSGHPNIKKISFKNVGKDPLVFGCNVDYSNPKTAATDFEIFHVGSYKWGENINTDMATPVYQSKRKQPVIKLQKPANMGLRNIGMTQVWFIDGLLDDYYKVMDGLRQETVVRPATVRDISFVINRGGFGLKLDSFPYDYEKLLKYDTIVFGGISLDALGIVGDEMLTDYMKAGGGMIVLGGPAAYGFSGMEESTTAKYWPVEFSRKPFDLIDTKGAVITPDLNSEVMKSAVDWNNKITVRYVHNVKVKPGAEVLARVGKYPFIVAWNHGPRNARVVCILGAAMGSVDKSKGTPFWNWSDWPYVMRNLLWWTSKQDNRFK